MPSPERDRSSWRRSVFINCPFDSAYQPLFRAACFTIKACGYTPRCALDYSDSGAVRFPAIVRLITQCGYSIHDISRVELDSASGLPRFNMPLELGADLGLRMEGPANQRARKILVLDAEPHRYDITLSDIAGMDIEVHGNQPVTIIKRVRNWLSSNRSKRAATLPGATAIIDDYRAYQELVPTIIQELRFDPHEELPHADFLQLIEKALPMIAAARS